MIPLGFGFNENQRHQNCISQDASVTGFKRKVRNPGPEDHIRLHFFEPGLRTFLTYFSSSPVYIRIHGKGDKERIVTITEKTVAHLRMYLKIYHSDKTDGMPLFYTVIKGRTDRMSPGNVGRIINKYARSENQESVTKFIWTL